MSTAIEWSQLSHYGLNGLKGLGVLILGWIVARIIGQILSTRLGNQKGLHLDDTFRPIVVRVVRYVIFFTALYAALQIAGIPAASLLAVMGAAGLAVALAVQGTLANIAAGLMILFLRILRVGDYVQTPDCEGTVQEIGLFTSWIKSSDGISISLPNAKLWSGSVKNFSRTSERRIAINIAVSTDNDLSKIITLFERTLDKNPLIMADKSYDAIISGFDRQCANLQIRAWFEAKNARGNSAKLRLELHQILRKNKVKFPTLIVS